MWRILRPKSGIEADLRNGIYNTEPKLGQLPDSTALAWKRAKNNTVTKTNELSGDEILLKHLSKGYKQGQAGHYQCSNSGRCSSVQGHYDGQ